MVELKRKVTLKTKVSDVTTPSDQPIQSESQNSNLKKQENGKKWGLLIVLVAVVVIAFLLFKPGKTDNDSFVVSQTVAETVENNTSETSTQIAEQGTPEAKANEDVVETKGNPNNSENVTAENNKSKSDSDAKASQSQEQPSATTSVKKTSSVAQSKDISVPVGTLEEKAKLVIRGDFGNGEERKVKLGSEYSAIQGKVNEMYAKGLVY
jgi:hypothetical protein